MARPRRRASSVLVVLRASAFAAMALVAAGCQATTDSAGRTVFSTPTLGQMLGGRQQPVPPMAIPVRNVGAVTDQRMVRGRTVQVASVGFAHQILVDGRVVATDEQDDRVVIQGVHEGGGRSYVLVEEQLGGNACPSMFQAIDLSGANPSISPQFGNCSDLPRVSVVNGALRVAVPAFRAARAAVFTFRDGRLSR